MLNVAFENPRSIAAAEDLLQRQSVKRSKSTREVVPKDALAEITGDIYDVPDRLTGKQSVDMLRKLHPDRDWRFIEINIDYQVSSAVGTGQ